MSKVALVRTLRFEDLPPGKVSISYGRSIYEWLKMVQKFELLELSSGRQFLLFADPFDDGTYSYIPVAGNPWWVNYEEIRLFARFKGRRLAMNAFKRDCEYAAERTLHHRRYAAMSYHHVAMMQVPQGEWFMWINQIIKQIEVLHEGPYCYLLLESYQGGWVGLHSVAVLPPQVSEAEARDRMLTPDELLVTLSYLAPLHNGAYYLGESRDRVLADLKRDLAREKQDEQTMAMTIFGLGQTHMVPSKDGQTPDCGELAVRISQLLPPLFTSITEQELALLANTN